MFLKDIIFKSICCRQADTVKRGCYVRQKYMAYDPR